MADYPSALTGAQMDAALLDVAQHNSEAWAVGTRNGFDVQSGDATYHNNSKYYAESAQSYAAIAQGAIPSGTAGALFYDRSQSLTDAQKMQGRANLAAGGSNRNLLDNPWFTINQRSATTIPVGGYGVDRWKGGSAGAANVVSGGLQFSGAANAYQVPDSTFFSSLVGKTATASLLFSDGTVQSGTKTITNSVVEFGTFNGVRLYISSSHNFNMETSAGASATIRAVKLEVGSYSTLANDVPPDYGEELRKCQRYFVRVPLSTGQACATGFANSTTSIRFLIPVPTTMRSSPSVAITGSSVANGNGAQLTISAFNTPAVLATCGVTCACTVSGATQYQSYSLSSTNTTSYIDLSADL